MDYESIEGVSGINSVQYIKDGHQYMVAPYAVVGSMMSPGNTPYMHRPGGFRAKVICSKSSYIRRVLLEKTEIVLAGDLSSVKLANGCKVLIKSDTLIKELEMHDSRCVIKKNTIINKLIIEGQYKKKLKIDPVVIEDGCCIVRGRIEMPHTVYVSCTSTGVYYTDCEGFEILDKTTGEDMSDILSVTDFIYSAGSNLWAVNLSVIAKDLEYGNVLCVRGYY